MADNHEWADANGLTVSRRSRDGVLIVAARGEIDLNSCAPLAQALAVPGEATAPRTVIDLSGVTFMDSTGINLLIGADRAARGARGWLRLAAPTEAVLRTMRLVGLDLVIPSYPTLSEALEA
ncbi:STAS domain-containing protein [Streptomyces longwoodensis]|uniref:STAS domain-containing protein n=1 Tax=Streptomyces longwoodensis TaxID=68231 RepID=UPI00082CC839|nr:STAS domain-containing protein [Streptomyces longwoodensis]